MVPSACTKLLLKLMVELLLLSGALESCSGTHALGYNLQDRIHVQDKRVRKIDAFD